MSSHESPEGELVHFGGRWPAAERAQIEAAARKAEAGMKAPPQGFGARWVITRHALPSFDLYTATRLGLSQSFVGRSADALADQIHSSRHWQAAASPTEEDENGAADSDAVFWLVYRSRAVRPLSDADLRTLLEEARAKNERLEITGVLLYRGERFMQVLEGEEAVVRDLYRTIRSDERHTDVETVHVGTIGQRAFPDWRMGAENLEAFDTETGTTTFLQDGTLSGGAGTLMEVARALEQFRRA